MGMTATTTRQRGRRVPTLRSTPILGAISELRGDYLGTILRAERELGPVVRIDAGPPGWRMTLYTVASPDLVTDILGHPDRYTKGAPSYRELSQAFGSNMLTSEGEVWRRQRRFLAPIFTPRRIQTTYAAIMVEETQAMVERWRQAAASATSVDAHAELITLTARIIGRILFGADVSTAIPKIMHFKFINDALLGRAISPHPMPRWVPSPANRQLAEELADLKQVVTDIIAERRKQPAASEEGANADDMLGLLLAARDSENADDRLTDEEVASQVLIFLLAGHDTTASTLACMLVELGRSEQWQSVVHEELAEVLRGRPPSAADIPRLPWTVRAVKEAMRLYPAAHGMARKPLQDEVLMGYHIPAGSTVIISPWVVHRSPNVWNDPETFDPRRFDVPAGEFPGGHRYAWFPFGAGPRACVGMQLAMLEAPIVLATILQAFRVSTTVTTIPLQAAITLRPTSPLPIWLHV